MTETELHRRLAEFADGEVDPRTREQLAAQCAIDAQARAEVRRWQALRRCTHRVLCSEQVPAGLAERILSEVRGPRLERGPRFFRAPLLRVGAPLAAAAAVAFAVFVVAPRYAAATPVKACDFARVYRACALEGRHDPFRVRGAQDGAGALDTLRGHARFPCKLMNVAEHSGYRVDGGCTCSPCSGLKVVHAYFRAADDPNEVISAFVMERRVKLCGPDGSACPGKAGCPRKGRNYHTASDGEVTVVSWDEADRTYVLVSRADGADLVGLADSLNLAVQMTSAAPTLGVTRTAP